MPSPIHRVHHAEIVNKVPFDQSCKFSFAEIIEKDSHGKRFGFTDYILDMRCIDMDAVELARFGQLDKTMDCCIGIATLNRQTREYSADKLLLVELKLNCKSHNLKPDDYKGKISHTLDLLSGYQSYRKKIFLFQGSVCSIAKSIISRWLRGSNPGELRDVEVLTPKLFNEFIGFEHQFERIPLTNADDIISSVNDASASAELLLKTIETWGSKANNFKKRYNLFEAKHIENTLREAVLAILPKFDDNEDRLLLEWSLPVERRII